MLFFKILQFATSVGFYLNIMLLIFNQNFTTITDWCHRNNLPKREFMKSSILFENSNLCILSPFHQNLTTLSHSFYKISLTELKIIINNCLW